MGNFNTSPIIPEHEILPEYPDHYQLLADPEPAGDGWVNANENSPDTKCTYCSENLTNDDEGEKILDYVFVRNA